MDERIIARYQQPVTRIMVDLVVGRMQEGPRFYVARRLRYHGDTWDQAWANHCTRAQAARTLADWRGFERQIGSRSRAVR